MTGRERERPESIYSDLNKRNWMRHENRLLTLILSLSLARSLPLETPFKMEMFSLLAFYFKLLA